MSAAPTVSILTPVYNGQAFLEEAVSSAARQTFEDWELLIVDNASKDGTRAIAQRWAEKEARIKLLPFEEFISVQENHNRAIAAMNPASKYCKFLHHDDVLYPECLARMVDVAERHPEVGVVSAFRLEEATVEHDGLLPPTREVMPGRDVVRGALLGPPWVTGSPSSLLFRAETVRRLVPLFDGTVWHADTDAAYRLLLESDLGFVHQVLSYTRLHEGALTPFSHQVNSYLTHEGRMLARYGRELLGDERWRDAMRDWLARYLWYLAKQRVKPSRLGDRRFHSFHRREIGLIEAELGEMPSFRGGLRACLLLLRRVSDAVPEAEGRVRGTAQTARS